MPRPNRSGGSSPPIRFLPLLGALLITSGRNLLRMEPDGSLETHANLGSLTNHGWNEIVVDSRGNVYVNGPEFDLRAGEKFAPGIVALVASDGSARRVADNILTVLRRHFHVDRQCFRTAGRGRLSFVFHLAFEPEACGRIDELLYLRSHIAVAGRRADEHAVSRTQVFSVQTGMSFCCSRT